MIQIAREKDPDGAIEYRVGDLSKPLPEYEEHFDAIASRLVLNDVYDYKGFIATLTSVLKPGGRLVVAMKYPYSYVVRKHLSDYFDSGSAYLYRGWLRKASGYTSATEPSKSTSTPSWLAARKAGRPSGRREQPAHGDALARGLQVTIPHDTGFREVLARRTPTAKRSEVHAVVC